MTKDDCECAGRALGTLLGQGARVCLGRDTRHSGPAVAGWVIQGLVAGGVEVVDYGVAPTPAVAALTRSMGFSAGIMITASHNPPEYNGIKLFDHEGVGFSREQEQRIESLCWSRDFTSGTGSVRQDDSALERYLETVPAALARAAADSRIPLMLDAGNGAASGFARTVFERLGLQVNAINDSPDGSFPGRGAEPSATTLGCTCRMLRSSAAQLAACFDGDADRVVFCDCEGFLGLDEMIAFMAQHRARQSRHPCLATTVETGLLPQYALEHLGGTVVRGRVGDVAVAHLTRQVDAALGAESIGVYIFPEQGLYPDSIVAVLHVLAAAGKPQSIRKFIGSLPRTHLVKRKVACPSALKAAVLRRADSMLGDELELPVNAIVNRTDGLRLEMPDSWLLVRSSGTEPVIRVTAEAAEAARADFLGMAADAIMTRLVAESARAAGSGGVE